MAESHPVIAIGNEYIYKKAIVLTDSLGKNIRYINTANIKSKGGCTIDRLTQDIRYLSLNNYDCVALLIGTCDISPKFVWDDYIKQRRQGIKHPILPEHSCITVDLFLHKYNNLISAIEQQNPTIGIVILSILPRKFHFSVNLTRITDINKALKKFCSGIHNCKFVKAYQKFTFEGKLKENLFQEDGIHLSFDGNHILKEILASEVGEVLKQKSKQQAKH